MKELADNLKVYVQKPNKPQTQKHVGYISSGYVPDDDDYKRWGITKEQILSERRTRRQGSLIYLIVEA
jgi:hypothetical protein